ncbi:unnamed protein product [Heterotrigona itama]|uniref:Uncharacterized protein n=1 Tax=Heterotrigona itama TaxID=395501 RepID=A0A6V7GVS5_9HYME|nr:unnamed protein product [Heterotrigona itama]
MSEQDRGQSACCARSEMGIGGPSVAALLLLLFSLGAESSMTTPSTSKETSFVNAAEINREILSMSASRDAIRRKTKEAAGKLDQSKVTMVNADDMRDLENLEDVLSVVGYEPRRIGNVGKRKATDTFNNTVNDPGKYINSPRLVDLQNASFSDRVASRSKQDTQKAIDLRPKSPIEARLSRPRSPARRNEKTKLYSTRESSRKRATTRVRGEESATSTTENYPRQFAEVHGPTNNETGNKSRRLSWRTKLAKPLASNLAESRKGNLEKFVGEEAASDGIRNFGGRNIQGDDARIGQGNTFQHTGSSREDSKDSIRTSESDGAHNSPEIPEESGSFADLDNSSKKQATPSSFQPHRDVEIPVSNSRSNNYVYHPSSLSAEETQESVENGESTEGDGKYENQREGRQVGNHDLKSHENEREPEGVKKEEEEEEDTRHAEKYDVRAEDDVASDGSHDTERHEGAAGRGKFEKGGATEREEKHRESDDEKGEKGYESWHEQEKANKGHHDKEQRSNYYDEKDAKQKEQKEEGGYHEQHQEDEKGEKQAEFDEKGKHQKGYNTKGQHFVHKKDEFEKRTEFFDESHEDGDAESNGELYHEGKMSKGGDYKAGHHDAGDHEQMFGKKSEHEESDHHRDDKGHEVKEGEDSHHEQENMHGEKKSHRDGKEWTYKKSDGADEPDKKKH